MDSLINGKVSWDLSAMPEYIRNATPSADQDKLSIWHTGNTPVILNAFITNAILEYSKATKSKYCLISVGEFTYSVESKQPDGTFVVATASYTGQLSGVIVNPDASRYTALPQIGGKSDTFDTTPILLMYLAMAADAEESIMEELNKCESAVSKGHDIPINSLYILNDAVQCGLNNNKLPHKIQQGNISILSKTRIDANVLAGTILCGVSEFIMAGAAVGQNKTPKTIGEAKKRVESYTNTLSWSPDEEQLIPRFDDDFKVPAEVWYMIEDFIGTRGKRLPFNNFGWRGTSGYGKTTGVKILGCILHTPVYAVACNPTMETQSFLSQFVPCSSPQCCSSELPSFDDIMCDPDGAYERLTGVYIDNVPTEELQSAYNDALVQQASNTSPSSFFKLVESDFVKALRTGAIVELQEYNIIKDAGVLKGLNAYDEPGAVIPLVDGGYTKRHPNAITVWTANIGYASSRDEEWSVARRIRTFYDVFQHNRTVEINRVMYNTENELDIGLVNKLYDLWDAIRVYCKEQQIHTDLSLTALENLCSCIARHGIDDIERWCKACIISQCSNDEETQDTIFSSVAEIEIAKISV